MRLKRQLSERQAFFTGSRQPQRIQTWFGVALAGDGAVPSCDGTSCDSDVGIGCEPGPYGPPAGSRGRQARSGGSFDGLR